MSLAQLFSLKAGLDVSKPIAQSMAAQGLKAQLSMSGQTDGIPEEQLDLMAQQQSAITLAMLTQQGLLRETARGYQADLSFEDGEMRVNGKPLPIGGGAR